LTRFPVILPPSGPLPPDGQFLQDDGGETLGPDRCPITGLGPDSTGDPDLDRLVIARRFDEGCA